MFKDKKIVFSGVQPSGTLTIGERSGSYPGMLAERTFVIRLAGTKEECKVIYKGEKLAIVLR